MDRTETLVIANRWALGDTICLTALVRDIHRAYPGRFVTRATGHYSCIWKNNLLCRHVEDPKEGRIVRLAYKDGINAAEERGQKVHFLSWFHRDLGQRLKLKVPVTEPKGDLYLTDHERRRLYDFPYWVVMAGGKLDMTAKVWAPERWQRTVDLLAARGIRVVQSGTSALRHFHPRLANCTSAIDKTNDPRDLLTLIRGAEGVICGITGAMHIAACFDKPCVVIAGGRESPHWEMYSNCFYPTAFGPQCAPVTVEHTYLHTIGLLNCGIDNLKKGCWKDRTVPIERTDHTDPQKRKGLCRKPLATAPPVPECMSLIYPEHVVEAVIRYYEEGILQHTQRDDHEENLRQVPNRETSG